MPAAPKRIGRAGFVGAIGRPGQPVPMRLPQIAFAGRSNVGKSSLINALVGRRNLARVAKAPGRTQEINFYAIDGRFLIADLPGYGFARAPEEVRRSWGLLIESYLATSADLLGLILLVDARRGASPEDRRMLEYLSRMELPTLFVLTKVDKLSRERQRAALAAAGKDLGAAADQILATSARTGAGIESLRESVRALVSARGGRGR
ncbi:MAG: ribosome biogenesis GTP-binding protein YihA/YsxC [Gemmatimonadota bacterium]